MLAFKTGHPKKQTPQEILEFYFIIVTESTPKDLRVTIISDKRKNPNSTQSHLASS